jgi:hypothetical protein
MRNNRLTKNTTDPNYDSIPFKNRDIDLYKRKSVEQLQAEEPILFKDLPEVTVRANAKPLSLKTASASKAGKDLLRANQMGKQSYPKQLPKKAVKEKKKWMTGENVLSAGVLGMSAGITGMLINDEIQARKWKKQNPPRDWSNFDPWNP